MKIYKDGDMWCLVQDDFTNLAESQALFVDDKELEELKKKLVSEAVIAELEHWARFFEDPSMNAMTPSERLRQRIEKLEEAK